MAFHYHQFDDISFGSLKKEFRNYGISSLGNDAFAGFSVALMTIPQAIAYAMLAGLPVSCGLFAAIYASIITAAFGCSRHLVVGPNSAIAILIQAGTTEILSFYYPYISGFERDVAALEILSQLALMVGAFQLLAGVCKLGRLTQFVSHSVVVGYVTGAAIAVVVNQSYILLGIPRMAGVQSFFQRGEYLLEHLHLIHWPTAAVGVGSLVLMILLRKISKHFPAGISALLVAGLLVYLLDTYLLQFAGGFFINVDLVTNISLVEDTAPISELIPNIVPPFFHMGFMNDLLPVAFAIALLGMMETTSISKTIAASSGQRLSVNQELFGIGLGNLFASLVGGMPVSGSVARSMVNFQSGAKTRLASIFNSCFAALLLISFGFLVSKIPLTALAALLLVSVTTIINPKHFLMCMRATRSDALVLWTTILSCVFFSLNTAFYIGVVISIILYLKKAAIPQLVEYGIDEQGELINLSYSTKEEIRDIKVIKVEGELFFGAADLFQTTLKAIAEDDINTKVLILQLKNARDIDATACLAIQYLHDYLNGTGCHLILCGLTPQVWEVLSEAGLVEKIGKSNICLFDERHPHHFMEKAAQRAKQLVGVPLSVSEHQKVQTPEMIFNTEVSNPQQGFI